MNGKLSEFQRILWVCDCDISKRRGQVTAMGDRGGNKIVDAFVPLAEMFGYSTDLRSMTQGRATYSMEFDHYEEVPANVPSRR